MKEDSDLFPKVIGDDPAMKRDTKKLIGSFCRVSRKVFRLANRDLERPEFLHEILMLILEFSQCEAAEIFLSESGRYHRALVDRQEPTAHQHETGRLSHTVLERGIEIVRSDMREFVALCCGLVAGRLESTEEELNFEDCFWTCENDAPISLRDTTLSDNHVLLFQASLPYHSIVIVPFDLEENDRGLLVLKHSEKKVFARGKVELLKGVAQQLGMSIVLRKTRLALRERMKEQACLYGIAKLSARADTPLEQVLESMVELIPPAWLYPDITTARIVLGKERFESGDSKGGQDKLRSEIIVEDGTYGYVEVTYEDKRPELDEGPFLKEERELIDAIAKEIALIVDQYRADQEKKEYQEQLRHADRLATIGQLSAGIAHELNEPLSGILGFGQLALKVPGVPPQAQRDLEKIVSASVHASSIVKKLLLFARQSQMDRNWVDLNMLVADGLYFLESRCAKSNIELVRVLDRELPEITADPSQIYQVLINLAVNAIQAMPDEGRLTIRTACQGSGIALEVEDTGIGMSQELQKKILLPFFTTKDVGEGTGLGLSVVDGIVTSHGGSIKIESREGIGTRFTVHLPIGGPVTDPI